MSAKYSNDPIGNLTRELPVCSAVPQPPALLYIIEHLLRLPRCHHISAVTIYTSGVRWRHGYVTLVGAGFKPAIPNYKRSEPHHRDELCRDPVMSVLVSCWRSDTQGSLCLFVCQLHLTTDRLRNSVSGISSITLSGISSCVQRSNWEPKTPHGIYHVHPLLDSFCYSQNYGSQPQTQLFRSTIFV